MEWLDELLTSTPELLLIPLFFIVVFFAMAFRRSHLKHLEQMDKIQNDFNPYNKS
jgi:hypothetical protein